LTALDGRQEKREDVVMNTLATADAAPNPPTFTPQQWECLQIVFDRLSELQATVEEQDESIAALHDELITLQQKASAPA
jgi:hypothetical protein